MNKEGTSHSSVKEPRQYTFDFPKDRILLDVGGVHYSTTLRTLCSVPHSYFYSMFSGVFAKPAPDENGRYFVDRNGKLFSYLLDFMRNGHVYLPEDEHLRRPILEEADYFGLDLISKEELEMLKVANSEDENVLNEVGTGGKTRAIAIAGLNGASSYYPGTLQANHLASWSENGMLFDESTNDPLTSFRTNPNSGTTWINGNIGLSVGILIVDLGRVCSISRYHVFAMRSDGQVTHVRILSHPDLLATLKKPDLNDDRWIEVLSWSKVTYGTDANNNSTTNPTIFNTDTIQTRFLRIEAKNDGSLGNEGYIEVRQVKAFL